MAGLLFGLYVVPLLVTTTYTLVDPPVVHEVDRMWAEHDCQPSEDVGHRRLLVRKADGRVLLLPPEPPASAWQDGDSFYGWCRP